MGEVTILKPILLKIFPVLFFLICMIYPRDSFAYLDPGTGSYILQIFLGVIFGAFFILRDFRSKIKNFFINLFSKENKHDKSSK
jgi:hypothetical protein